MFNKIQKKAPAQTKRDVAEANLQIPSRSSSKSPSNNVVDHPEIIISQYEQLQIMNDPLAVCEGDNAMLAVAATSPCISSSSSSLNLAPFHSAKGSPDGSNNERASQNLEAIDEKTVKIALERHLGNQDKSQVANIQNLNQKITTLSKYNDQLKSELAEKALLVDQIVQEHDKTIRRLHSDLSESNRSLESLKASQSADSLKKAESSKDFADKIEKLVQENGALKRKLEQSTGVVKKYKTDLSETIKSKDHEIQLQKDLVKRMEALQTDDNKKFNDTQEKLTREIAQLKSKVDTQKVALRDAGETASEKWLHEKKKSEDKITQLKGLLKKQNDKIKTLNSEIEQTKSTSEAQISELQQILVKVQAEQSENKSAVASTEKIENEMRELRSAKDAIMEELEEARLLVEEYNQLKKNQSGANQKLNEQIAKLKSVLESRDLEIEKVKNDLKFNESEKQKVNDAAKLEEESLQQSLSAKNAEIQNIQELLQKALKECAQSKAMTDSLELKLGSTEKEKDEHIEKFTRKINAEVNEEKERRHSDIKALEEIHMTSIGRLEATVIDLESRLEESCKSFESKAKELEVLRNAEIENKRSLENATQSLEDYESEISILQHKFEGVHQDLLAERVDREKLGRQRNELFLQIEDQNQEIAKLQETNTAYKKVLKQSQLKVTDLTSLVEKQKAEYDIRYQKYRVTSELQEKVMGRLRKIVEKNQDVDVDELGYEIRRLNEELEIVRTARTAADYTTESLGKQLEASINKADIIQKQLNDKDDEIQKLIKVRDSYKRDLLENNKTHKLELESMKKEILKARSLPKPESVSSIVLDQLKSLKTENKRMEKEIELLQGKAAKSNENDVDRKILVEEMPSDNLEHEAKQSRQMNKGRQLNDENSALNAKIEKAVENLNSTIPEKGVVGSDRFSDEHFKKIASELMKRHKVCQSLLEQILKSSSSHSSSEKDWTNVAVDQSFETSEISSQIDRMRRENSDDYTAVSQILTEAQNLIQEIKTPDPAGHNNISMPVLQAYDSCETRPSGSSTEDLSEDKRVSKSSKSPVKAVLERAFSIKATKNLQNNMAKEKKKESNGAKVTYLLAKTLDNELKDVFGAFWRLKADYETTITRMKKLSERQCKKSALHEDALVLKIHQLEQGIRKRDIYMGELAQKAELISNR